LAVQVEAKTAAESIGGVGLHATAVSAPEQAPSKWPVPEIASNASPGRLKFLGKREVEWDEGLGYLVMADFDNDPDLLSEFLRMSRIPKMKLKKSPLL
jgi:hypothetical protein